MWIFCTVKKGQASILFFIISGIEKNFMNINTCADILCVTNSGVHDDLLFIANIIVIKCFIATNNLCVSIEAFQISILCQMTLRYTIVYHLLYYKLDSL